MAAFNIGTCQAQVTQQLSSSAFMSGSLTLAKLHVFILGSFIKFNKAPTKFNEALTKPCLGLIEIYYKFISDIIVNDYTTKR